MTEVDIIYLCIFLMNQLSSFSNNLGDVRVGDGASFEIPEIIFSFFFHRDLTAKKTTQTNIVRLGFFMNQLSFFSNTLEYDRVMDGTSFDIQKIFLSFTFIDI